MCSSSISVLLSKSAIVLATFSILPYALALSPNFSNAFSNIFFPLFVNLQYFSINFGVSSEFDTIVLSSLYLSN